MTIDALPNNAPPRGEVAVEAVLFDTFGTVCDFYLPMKRAFEDFAASRGLNCDAGQMAIEWRTAYLISTSTQAFEETEFLPLRAINRTNLLEVLSRHLAYEIDEAEVDALNATWEKLDPWPDAVEGLKRIRRRAIIAPTVTRDLADNALRRPDLKMLGRRSPRPRA